MDILVATDFSDNSKTALKQGAFLAKQQMGSELEVVHVVDLSVGDNAWRILVETPEEIEEEALEEAQTKLEAFVAETLDELPEKITYTLRLGNPVDELLELAAGRQDPLILVGTRGASRVKEFLLGNTSRRLVRRGESSVVLVPADAPVGAPKDLVVGVDFSALSKQALRRAAMMARTYDAKMHVVYGYVLPEVATFDGSMASVSSEVGELVEEKEAALGQMLLELGVDDVVESIDAVQLPPAQAIRATAEEREAGYIFVGTHGRRGVKRFFLGNTAERVIRKAPCSIFVVHGADEKDAD